MGNDEIEVARSQQIRIINSERAVVKAEKVLIESIRSNMNKGIASSGDDSSSINRDSSKPQVDASKVLIQSRNRFSNSSLD